MEALTLTWTLMAIIFSILAYQYIKLKSKELYWKEKGVAYPKVENFCSGILQIINNEALIETWHKVYNGYPKHKFVAIESINATAIMTRDPEFLGKIITKDFQYFVDRNQYNDDRDTLVNLGLFTLTGKEWRGFRLKLSPTFTTGKLKSMFEEIELCSDAMLNKIDKNCGNPDYEITDDIMTYAMDVTASVIFGIELKNRELREMYKKTTSQLFNFSVIRILISALLDKFPKLSKMLNLKLLDRKKEKFYKDIIKETFEQRKAKAIIRNDYVQLLLKLKEFGKLEVKVKHPEDDYLNTEDLHVENVEVTDDILAAQAFQFLSAGFEPIYSTMLLFLSEVSKCKDIQEKLRKEIKIIKEKYGGYDYNSIKEMIYLDMSIQEKCINPESKRPYPVSMIEKAMKDIHFSIKPNRNVKQQTLDVIPQLKAVMPLERAQMRLRVAFSGKEARKLRTQLVKLTTSIETENWNSEGELEMVCLIDPGRYREVDELIHSTKGCNGLLELLNLKEITEGEELLE